MVTNKLIINKSLLNLLLSAILTFQIVDINILKRLNIHLLLKLILNIVNKSQANMSKRVLRQIISTAFDQINRNQHRKNR
jgi:hypothetical protein